MLLLSNLNKFLHDFLHFDKNLDIERIDPIMTNGLMVRGKEEIRKIGFGVSASLALFEEAKNKECDALIVHHSFNLPAHNHYDAIFQNRIEYLLRNEISLFGYHFLLDAHPEIGHNVEIIKKIGAKPAVPYFHRGQPWGWEGEFSHKVLLADIEEKILPFLSKKSVFYRFGPQKIKRLVVVSGMGAPVPSDMHILINNHIDLYITGEVHEWNRELFKEAQINFIAGGHYATEVFGLRALMKKVKDKFPKVDVEWIMLTNEI